MASVLGCESSLATAVKCGADDSLGVPSDVIFATLDSLTVDAVSLLTSAPSDGEVTSSEVVVASSRSITKGVTSLSAEMAPSTLGCDVDDSQDAELALRC